MKLASMRRQVFRILAGVLLAAGWLAAAAPAAGQESTLPAKPRPIILKQVAPDLYFLFDYASSVTRKLAFEDA